MEPTFHILNSLYCQKEFISSAASKETLLHPLKEVDPGEEIRAPGYE